MSNIQQRWDCAAARPYTNSNGEAKKQWINVGRAVQWSDGNIQIELTAMPCFPNWDGKISLFAPKEREGSGQQRQPTRPPAHRPAPPATHNASFEDDPDPIPF